MYGFKIISSRFVWEGILKHNFNNIDIYYTYEYGQLFAQQEKGELLAAHFESENTQLFYPFIKRTIQRDEENLYDIVTPYGYGGPYIEGENQLIIAEFYEAFDTYCNSNNIITETIRCHPLIKNYRYLNNSIDLNYIRKTTAVDLTNSLEEIRSNYSSMNKRNIKKAKKEGLTCYTAKPTKSNIKIFMKLYKETMDRNLAGSYYYFKENYFYDQMKETKLSKTYLLFTTYDDEVIAGVIVIVGKKYSHYHLGASRTAYLYLRPNNLLFDYMIEVCKNRGSSLLHLGGGYEENDGLYKFKSSFTNNNNYDYFIGKNIYNQELYNKITNEIKNEFEINVAFFPAYRGIIKPKLVIK